MRKIVLLFFAASLVVGCADTKSEKDETSSKEKNSKKSSEKEADEDEDATWSDEQKQAFIDDCRDGEMKSSVTSKEDCACIYKNLSARVSYQDYRFISGKAKEDEASEDEASEKSEKLSRALNKVKEEVKDDCGISLGKE